MNEIKTTWNTIGSAIYVVYVNGQIVKRTKSRKAAEKALEAAQK